MTVHIIEDDAGVRDALGELCRSFGRSVQLYDSCKAFGGGEQCQATDLLVVDLGLPDASGVEIVRTIRKRQWPPRIIVISGLSHKEIAREMRGLEAVTVIRKPLAPEILKIFG